MVAVAMLLVETYRTSTTLIDGNKTERADQSSIIIIMTIIKVRLQASYYDYGEVHTSTFEQIHKHKTKLLIQKLQRKNR